MPSWIGPWEISIRPELWGIVPLVFFLISMQRALKRCSPENRALSPRLVWLGLIPVFNLVWQFVVVVALGRSLGNEYRARGLRGPARPGLSLGIAMACVWAVSIVAYFGLWASVLGALGRRLNEYYSALSIFGLAGILFLAGLVLWIIYWVKIHQYSSRLVGHQWWSPPQQPASAGGASFCTSCGLPVVGVRYCPRCGEDQASPADGPRDMGPYST